MSRLVIISSEAAAEQPEIQKIVAAFIEQTLQKWANTEIIQQRLTPQTALDCQTQSQQTDYLALAFCAADWQADSPLQHYLQVLRFPNSGAPHLVLFGDGSSLQAVEPVLSALELTKIDRIQVDSEALQQQLAALFRC